MDPTVITALVTASPIAGAVIYVVMMFLKFIREEREAQQVERKQLQDSQVNRDAHIERLGQTCHAAHKALVDDQKQFHRETLQRVDGIVNSIQESFRAKG